MNNLLFFIETTWEDPDSEPELVAVWATDGQDLEFDYIKTVEYGERFFEMAAVYLPKGKVELPPAVKLNKQGMQQIARSLGYTAFCSEVFEATTEKTLYGWVDWAIDNIDELAAKVRGAKK
jgi:hypothetical protein